MTVVRLLIVVLLLLPLLAHLVNRHVVREGYEAITSFVFSQFARERNIPDGVHSREMPNEHDLIIGNTPVIHEKKTENGKSAVNTINSLTSAFTSTFAKSIDSRKLPVFAAILTCLWIISSILVALKLTFGLIHLVAVYRTADAADQEIEEKIWKLSFEMGIHAPRVIQHQSIESLYIVGIRKPVIYIPARNDLKRLITDDRFIHELAHIKNRDFLWNMFGQVLRIIIPLNPLVWILTAYHEKLSDYICDDYVIVRTGEPKMYARRLFVLATKLTMQKPVIATGVGIISTKSVLRKRIERILANGRSGNLELSLVSTLACSFTVVVMTCLTGFVNVTGSGVQNTKREAISVSDEAAVIPLP
jgi:beta-lactamase regulating signal transducer with metallopeptidase domain